MFGFGKKRTKLISKSEDGKMGILLFKCPCCNNVVGDIILLEGKSLDNLKKELEITCPQCSKEIIVET